LATLILILHEIAGTLIVGLPVLAGYLLVAIPSFIAVRLFGPKAEDVAFKLLGIPYGMLIFMGVIFFFAAPPPGRPRPPH
jgi:hypothetical protein